MAHNNDLFSLLFAAQLNVGFTSLVHRVKEDGHVLKVDLTKNGENVEEIVVLVTPITFSEYHSLYKAPLPSEFDGIELPDAAECESNMHVVYSDHDKHHCSSRNK